MDFKKVNLRRAGITDLDLIYEIYTDKGVIKNQNVYPMKKRLEALEYYLKNFSRLYVIEVYGMAIGLISRNKGNEINFIIKKRYRNKGYMKDALKEFFKFGNVKFGKIFARVNPKNLAAIKVVESVGFVQKRIEYNSIFNLYTNELEDEIVYSYK